MIRDTPITFIDAAYYATAAAAMPLSPPDTLYFMMTAIRFAFSPLLF